MKRLRPDVPSNEMGFLFGLVRNDDDVLLMEQVIERFSQSKPNNPFLGHSDCEGTLLIVCYTSRSRTEH